MITNYIVLLLCYFHATSAFTHPAPKTVGEPWPLPQVISKSNYVQTLSKLTFDFEISPKGNDCNLLREAMNRCYENIFRIPRSNVLKFHALGKSFNDLHSSDRLNSLELKLENACEKYPSLHMNESCKSRLTVIYLMI